jgi:putative hydrolase of the HAD superfamily
MDNYQQNNRGKVKAFIFDLDGTLYNERDFVRSGFRVVARHVSIVSGLNYELVYTNLMVDFENGLRFNNFDVLLNKLGLLDIRSSDLVKIYREHRPEIHLYPDAEIILKELKDNVKLGLITDGPRKTQNNKVSVLNIKQYFQEIIINDIGEKERLKPDTKSFKIMLKKLGANSCESIYVGDNPMKDFIGAKEIGMFTIRVRRDSGEYDHIETDKYNDADLTVTNLLILKSLLVEGYYEI